jgi:hypothetical protein
MMMWSPAGACQLCAGPAVHACVHNGYQHVQVLLLLQPCASAGVVIATVIQSLNASACAAPAVTAPGELCAPPVTGSSLQICFESLRHGSGMVSWHAGVHPSRVGALSSSMPVVCQPTCRMGVQDTWVQHRVLLAVAAAAAQVLTR